jgi:FtsP/CotA-like multicopper oxidase with cupredoxin domain
MSVAAACAVALATSHAAAAPSPCRAGLPAALAAPAGNELAFELQAIGVQVYACTGTIGAPAWTFQAPEATLTGPDGQAAGKHFAGPTWEGTDGSRVVGAKVAAATPDPAAIPWLLLGAASHAGGGRMAEVTFVQRVATSGGNAPAAGCDASHVGEVARVPYRAAYCFYRASGATR